MWKIWAVFPPLFHTGASWMWKRAWLSPNLSTFFNRSPKLYPQVKGFYPQFLPSYPQFSLVLGLRGLAVFFKLGRPFSGILGENLPFQPFGTPV